MLDKLLKLFDDNRDHSEQISEEQLRLSTAALLIEVAVIDNSFDQLELQELSTILNREMDLSTADLEQLIEDAHQESKEATSIYQFTRLVNKHISFEQKFKLLTNMWRIAYADGKVDKYEEYIIRKVSDLIYLSHGDFIRAKQLARDSKIQQP